jgi:hypothetical protein
VNGPGLVEQPQRISGLSQSIFADPTSSWAVFQIYEDPGQESFPDLVSCYLGLLSPWFSLHNSDTQVAVALPGVSIVSVPVPVRVFATMVGKRRHGKPGGVPISNLLFIFIFILEDIWQISSRRGPRYGYFLRQEDATFQIPQNFSGFRFGFVPLADIINVRHGLRHYMVNSLRSVLVHRTLSWRLRLLLGEL